MFALVLKWKNIELDDFEKAGIAGRAYNLNKHILLMDFSICTSAIFTRLLKAKGKI